MDIVSAQVAAQRLRRAVVRSMLTCNLVLVLDSSSLSVAAEKSAGMPSTTAIDKNLKKLKQIGILRRVGPDKGGHWEVVQ